MRGGAAAEAMAGVGCDGGDGCGGDDGGDKGAGDAWRLSKPLAMVVVTALEMSMRKGGGRYGGGEGGGKR